MRLLAIAVASLLVAGLLAALTTTPAVSATDPCGPAGNKIACENSKPGSPPSEWEVQGAGDASIQGFATDISANVGSRIDFKIDTSASAYTIRIYRLGYYGGDGARRVDTISPSASLPQRQPQCITEAATELYDCGNWGVSASWNVPSTAVSGVYIALLNRPDLDESSHITFVVRDDSSTSDVVFQTSDPTWQAYNTYGGSNFYSGGANGRAYKVSYNRPVLTRDGIGGRDFFFSNEYPLVRFLEKNGYDTSYIAGVDTDRRGGLLTRHKTFLSVGHDEYWSGRQRANVEAARDAGVNLMFLSGNEVYWRTRYEPSADSSRTSYRTLVCYKETWANAKIDPADEWTGTWRDPRYAPRSKGGGLVENGLTGTAYMSNFSDLPLTVTREEGRLRLWRNTTLASMSTAQTALAQSTVGYESDEDLDNGERPPGLVRLSTTVGDVPQYLNDFGNDVTPGRTEHHLTMYRAASGALVFGAGTVQWTWGLDSEHDAPSPTEPADRRMQQAQVNLLADMGAQPVTLDSTLVATAKSTDTTGPTLTIGAPAAGAAQSNGRQVTVTGTATDTGGRVAAVEASTDGGETWHAASGRESWSYTFIQHGKGSTELRVRAVDDSANIGATVTRSFNVSCPCSVFGDTAPKNPTTDDASSAELGLRFQPNADGFVTGVRFYKGTGNTGTHVGTLWNTDGQKLASVTFGNESASGWQQATFSGSPVAVSAGQTYVVSYTVPNGHYASAPFAFSARGVDAGPLYVDGGYGATPAGVYGNAGQYPTTSYQNTNYYVDVLFTSTDDSPLIATNQWPLADSSSVPLDTTISARYSKPLAAGTQGITVKDSLGTTVQGTTTYSTTTRTITFTPSQPLAGFVKYTVTLTGTDTQGIALTTGKSWSFTTVRPPATPGVCPCTLFDESLVPSTLNATDGTPLTLGVRFAASQDGQIAGLKFYKSPNNTGTHTGTLWSMNGTALATGTFKGESSSGWQTLLFDDPVPISKDTEYVVSYQSPTGWFSLTPNAFAQSDLSRAPLRVASNSGAFTYGTGFPSSSTSSNYLVDPIFEPPRPSIKITSQDPAPGAVDVDRGSPVVVRFSAPLKDGYSLTVRQGGTVLPGTTTLASTGTKLTFTPSQAFAKDVDVTVALTGITSTEGATMADQTWTFHTSGDDDVAAPQSLFGDVIPAVSAAPTDSSPVELGTAFTPSTDGKITSIRFFKGTGNGGTHTGSLWDSSGNRLATVTFSGETASGWQTAKLATPVAVRDGSTYVVSYYAPQGRYSYTTSFFASPWTSGDLIAPATNNGRYLYGAGGGFPTYSWGATNYFVDVVFKADAPTISVTDRTPAAGASDVLVGVKPSITFSAPIASGYSMKVSAGGSPVAGTVALSSTSRQLTFTPSSPLPAGTDVTVTVSGVVSTRGAVLPTESWTFRTEAAATEFASLMADQTPATASANDGSAIELGTAFTPSVAGAVTAIRFYKGAGNNGVHTGSVWDAAGNRLATVTFTGETATGWQTATLATPLQLAAGQTYVVSYYAPNGSYSSTPSWFSTPRTVGPLSAPTTNNGRYRYGAGGGFPTSSWNATNYFVDVVFRYAR